MDYFSIIICLILIAYFSSLIVAYTYSNKIFLNLESKKENITSYTLKILAENPRLYVSSLKAGNTIALIVFSFYFISLSKRLYQTNQHHFSSTSYSITCIAIAVTLIYSVSKFIPQTFIKPYANKVLLGSNLPIQLLIKLFSPITKPLLKASDWLLSRVFHLKQDKENQLLSISELGSYITKQIETVEENEKLETELQILKNALSFSDVLVKKIMVPKLEIEAINVNASSEEITTKFIETGYSRLLVFEQTEDNIIGYLHIFEILGNSNFSKDMVYPLETVNENSLIKDLFKRLSVKKKSIAKVISTEGKFSGIITMEDIIEELFGEIDDEHDENTEIIEKQIAPNKYIFSARLDLEDLNTKFNLNLKESQDYGTLAGYILHHHKKIPSKGETIKIENYTFKILSATDKKIEIVQIITT